MTPYYEDGSVTIYHGDCRDGGRWSRGGWHWLACWEQWSHDPERECVCDRLRRAATVAECAEHDEDGPPADASGYPTCSKCGAILTAAALPPEQGEPRLLRWLRAAPTRRMFARALGGGEHPNDEYLSMATAVLDKVATEVEDKPWLT